MTFFERRNDVEWQVYANVMTDCELEIDVANKASHHPNNHLNRLRKVMKILVIISEDSAE
jgi:hypothetical protein